MKARRASWGQLAIMAIMLLFAARQKANSLEDTYFVTDHHHLPEAGTLGIANYSVLGAPRNGNGFLASQVELEYRITNWWGTQVQFDGQTTWSDSTLFTGFSWTNKFKLFPNNHLLNAALVVGLDKGNAADKSIAEIEGRTPEVDFNSSNSELRKMHEHEVELKLIISRDHKGWNFAGNIMAAKNMAGEPWEFGYSLGASRPLSTADGDGPCVVCRKSVSAGLEFYGGLGDVHSIGLQNTPHYLGPEMSWKLTDRLAVKVGPHFGLTPQSQQFLVHFGVIYDIPKFNQRMAELFHGH
jgi:hypothetical protein